MFRAYLLLNSEQEELLKYESFKLQLFNYLVVFFSCIGVCKTCSWIYDYSTYFYRTYYIGEAETKGDSSIQRTITRKVSNVCEANSFRPEQLNAAKRKIRIFDESQHAGNDENVRNKNSNNEFNMENAKIPDTPSPESIMGVAAAAATAATVFMDKKRTKLYRKCTKD
jgi:hypothetical protein